MIKFIQKFLVVFFVITAGFANAGLITEDLTEDNYVTIGQLDWVWASIVNISPDTTYYNEISGPTDVFESELNVSWRYAEKDELDTFIKNIVDAPAHYRDLFTLKDENGIALKHDNGRVKYRHAINIWNSDFDDVYSGGSGDGSNVDNFLSGRISSHLTDNNDNWYYETFYVRNTQVPEPATIMIFAIALIALSMRKRLVK